VENEQRIFKTNMITPIGTFQWIYFDKPKIDRNNEEKPPVYTVTLLIDKKDKKAMEKWESMKECVKNALEKRFLDKVPAKFYTPLKDGDIETNKDAEPAYPGHFYIEAKNKEKPGLVDEDREPILHQQAIWSGCKGRLSVGFVGYDVASKKGVTIYLNNIQLTDTSAPKMGGRKSAEEDFAEE
tara:strand:- start:11289 stop:11837 length:549 start_codon:yes stop_codon:yes gene_type:complete